MNASVKKILQKLNIYYPLHAIYRKAISGYRNIKIRRQYSKYKGKGYNCNYCNASYTKFVPWYPAAENKEAVTKNNVIAGYGENIICPNCMSTARERLLKAMVVSSIDIDKKKILHISPEKKFYDFIKGKGIVQTVDLYPEFYTSIDPFIQFEDATNLSFDDASFDIVIGNHIMEHIPDDIKAMKEIYRVLRPGGKAILQVPFSETIVSIIEEPGINNPAKQASLFGQHDHVRIYSLGGYMERLNKAGFTVKYLSYHSLDEFYPYAIQKGEGFISIEK